MTNVKQYKPKKVDIGSINTKCHTILFTIMCNIDLHSGPLTIKAKISHVVHHSINILNHVYLLDNGSTNRTEVAS